MIKAAPDMKVRLPADLRRKIEDAAIANRRTLNGEIVARLSATFDVSRSTVEPGDQSELNVAQKALELAEQSARRIAAVKKALKVFSNDEPFVDSLNIEGQRALTVLYTSLMQGDD